MIKWNDDMLDVTLFLYILGANERNHAKLSLPLIIKYKENTPFRVVFGCFCIFAWFLKENLLLPLKISDKETLEHPELSFHSPANSGF